MLRQVPDLRLFVLEGRLRDAQVPTDLVLAWLWLLVLADGVREVTDALHQPLVSFVILFYAVIVVSSIAVLQTFEKSL